MKFTLAIILSFALLISCGDHQKDNSKTTTGVEETTFDQTIYFGGDIITMEGDKTNYTEAVVQNAGEIIFIGSKEEAFAKYGEKANKMDLKGKTMMPGFIEPHIHPSIAATMLPNEIIAPYDWTLPNEVKKGVSGHDEYIKRVTASVQENAKPDEIYFIWGYHQLWHGELSREILNKIAPEQAVAIIHRSFHEIYVNDKAIEKMGIAEEDFKGNSQVEWAKGHFFEGGWLALVPKIAPVLLEPTRYGKGLGIMTQLIRKNGITTVAEPGFPSSDFDGELALLKIEMEKKPPYDCYLIPNGTQLYSMKGGNEEALEFSKTLDKEYNTDNIKFLPGQIKLFADGAIYSQLMQMKDNYTDGHEGEWMTPLDLFKEQITLYWNAGYKIHVHSNGDKGIQQVLDFLTEDQKVNPREDHRFTLHHMGYFTDEMAQQIADMGVEGSVNPYYLWALADKYAENGLGKDRAEHLVRLKSLTSRNIPVSFHSDFSMAPMEPLTLAWTAVNRETSEHHKFSQDQKVDVFTAMKAITITAARTLNLENEMGSIKNGKVANFTILDENPFKVDPMKIKDIKVHGVIFKGTEFLN